jgi:hypothetical protein
MQMTILNGRAKQYGGGLAQTQEEFDAFLDYCRFMTRKGAGVIDQCELWNEWSHGTGGGMLSLRQPRKNMSI